MNLEQLKIHEINTEQTIITKQKVASTQNKRPASTRAKGARRKKLQTEAKHLGKVQTE
jgi:hypothetical protein